MNSSALTRSSSAKIPTALAKILANVRMASCASISVFIYCSYVKHEGDDYLCYLGANSNKYASKVASQELEPSKNLFTEGQRLDYRMSSAAPRLPFPRRSSHPSCFVVTITCCGMPFKIDSLLLIFCLLKAKPTQISVVSKLAKVYLLLNLL